MIIVPVIGTNFRGCVDYVMDKPGAELLFYNGVRGDEKRLIAQDFNMVASLRPSLKKAVWHFPISFAYSDNPDNKMMMAICKDFLSAIGLASHQFIIVRHHDTKHEHLHIVANRIGFDGNVVSDSFSKGRCAKISDTLEVKYNLTVAREARKNQVNIADASKLKGKQRLKREIKDFIRLKVERYIKTGTKTFDILKRQLSSENIELRIQENSAKEVTGVSFCFNGMAFKGTVIHENLRAKKLAASLKANRLKRGIRIGK